MGGEGRERLGHLIILGLNLQGFPFGYYPEESSGQRYAYFSLVTSKRSISSFLQWLTLLHLKFTRTFEL